jgi:hypothetical protein
VPNDSLQIDNKKMPGAAAGQYRGYALQAVRVCAHLLECEDGERVWLEHLDDVGTERSSKERLLEHAASHNPVADWAENLWKSLAHWVALCVSDRVDTATSRFRLYVVQKHTGEVVRQLHDARTSEDVTAIISRIEAAITARGGMPKGAGPYVKQFLACDPGLRAAIVRNFELSTGADDPIGKLLLHFRNTVSDAAIDEAIDAALGWVKRRIEEQLKAGSTVWIEATRFKSWLKGWLRRHDRDHVLASLDRPVDAEMIASELKLRTYIRQLDAIECAADEKIDAASDFPARTCRPNILEREGLSHRGATLSI